ncbi:hypothetical protein [Mangrovitalea sediminis]|uniref:hypothetical protein n=1 Tax=Mangrovitalea sediminis TaxID=1982043 RepID=UPI000BE575DD|nr:hypothetical protein [Mangrovitalea sediminis]
MSKAAISTDVQFHRRVGLKMAAAIREVLWNRPGSHRQGVLVVRLGSGRATYHRYDPVRREHLINLGLEMIAAKQQPGQCGEWLSTREILNRGYFQRQVSVAHLLAHTCVHEFAHLVQTVQGERRRGAVHNPAFYRILDNLHADGVADAVLEYLTSAEEVLVAPLDATPVTVAMRSSTVGFRRGDCVAFAYRQQTHTGRITRVNRRTCSVDGTGASRGLRFRVSPSLLERLDGP